MLMKARFAWRPQKSTNPKKKYSPQEKLVACPLSLIGFGGARGGGKSDGVLGLFAINALRYSGDNQVFFRQEVTQSDDLIARAIEIFEPLGAKYKIQQKEFVWANGSRTRFRALQNIKDTTKYQGQNITRIGIEEAGNYHDPKIIWRLFGCLRSAKGIPTQMILTFNPGGAGHHWLKEIFIDPHPEGSKIIDIKINKQEIKGIFIKSLLEDNPLLLEKDPNYEKNLYLVGSEALVNAWRFGSWDDIEGAFFKLTAQNFTSRFDIPDNWTKYIGQDWGFNSPFACTWVARSSGKDDKGKPHIIPKDTLVVYRAIKKTNLENTEQAELVYNASIGETITRAVLDPACGFGKPKSIAYQLNLKLSELNSSWYYQEANNNRHAGWSFLRELINTGRLIIFDDLLALINDLQTLETDENDVEDVDTHGEDHLPDSLRYCTMQYFIDTLKSEYVETPPVSKGVDLGKLIKMHKQGRTRL